MGPLNRNRPLSGMDEPNEVDDFFRDKEGFLEAVVSLDWESIDRTKQAKLFGVTRQTILNWEKKLDWEWVRTERQKRFARNLAKVDHALLEKAEAGSIAHIELAYARFDGYVPVRGTIDLSDKKDDELKKRADEIKAQLLGEGTGSGVPGTGEARA